MADNIDAAIPKEVREQFQCDENGRILFFTGAPLDRPANRVAEAYSQLGHSVRHLASIKQLREERARKRKERDEALARKRAAQEEEAKRQRLAQEQDGNDAATLEQKKAEARELLEKVLRGWAAEIDRGTQLLREEL